MPERSGYTVYIDFENIWMKNYELALPSLTPGSQGPARTIDPTLADKLHLQLQRFPALLLEIIQTHFSGLEAREKIAMALWKFLRHSKTGKLEVILPKAGIKQESTLPEHEAKTFNTNELKNASDFALIAKALQTIDGAGRNDATVVFCGGDSGPSYFVDLLISRGYRILFVAFAANVSPLIPRAAKMRPVDVSYLPLESTAIYQAYLAECAVVDPAAARLCGIPVVTRVEKTAIHYLWYAWNSKKAPKPYKPDPFYFRKKWIVGWLQYWLQYEQSTQTGAANQFLDEQHWFQHLVQQGIIEIKLEHSEEGEKKKINLNLANATVLESISELESDIKLYKSRYNVAEILK